MDYEGGIHVPFIVSWPDHLEGGNHCDVPMWSIDLLPPSWMLQACPCQKISLWMERVFCPRLRGEVDQLHEELYLSSAGANGKWAIRSGQWKLVAERERLELFDLQSDLSEIHNLAEKHPDILAELKDKYYQWLSQMADPVSGQQKIWDPSSKASAKKDREKKKGSTLRNGKPSRTFFSQLLLNSQKNFKRIVNCDSGFHRRYNMRLNSLFLVLCIVGLYSPPAPAERPNIIMFLIDDQNPSSIASFGGDTYTPNLDAMTEEGMKFTRAYVSSSVCTPSRYSFLTGRFAGNSYSQLYQEAVGGMEYQGLPGFNVALERDQMNVGRVLQDAGYATGFVGKFHLNSEPDFPELFEGKNGWIEIPKDAKSNTEIKKQFMHNERLMREHLKELGFSWAKNIYPENIRKPFGSHNPEWTTVAALEFIEQHQEGPFYLHLCSTLLHGPDKSWRNSMDHPRVTGVGEMSDLPSVMTPRAELLKTITEKGFDPNSHVAGEAD